MYGQWCVYVRVGLHFRTFISATEHSNSHRMSHVHTAGMYVRTSNPANGWENRSLKAIRQFRVHFFQYLCAFHHVAKASIRLTLVFHIHAVLQLSSGSHVFFPRNSLNTHHIYWSLSSLVQSLLAWLFTYLTPSAREGRVPVTDPPTLPNTSWRKSLQKLSQPTCG